MIVDPRATTTFNRRRSGGSFRERGWGWGYTYSSKYPLIRIDYIFHTRHWQAVEYQTGSRHGSDHLPVFAELILVR